MRVCKTLICWWPWWQNHISFMTCEYWETFNKFNSSLWMNHQDVSMSFINNNFFYSASIPWHRRSQITSSPKNVETRAVWWWKAHLVGLKNFFCEFMFTKELLTPAWVGHNKHHTGYSTQPLQKCWNCPIRLTFSGVWRQKKQIKWNQFCPSSGQMLLIIT